MGVISDKISFRKIVAPLFIVIVMMHLPIYLGRCRTCTWMILIKEVNASFTIAGNIVLNQLIARSIKGGGRVGVQ